MRIPFFSTVSCLFTGMTLCTTLLILAISPALAADSIFQRGVVSGADSDVALRNITLQRMDAIKSALEKFATANNVVPCPSVSTDTSNTVGSAASTTNPGTACAGDSAGMGGSSNIVAGMVPVRTLNLPNDYIYDAWGRRFIYVIDRQFAHKGTLATDMGNITSLLPQSSYFSYRAGELEVYNKAVAGQRVDGGQYKGPMAILLSYGPNGYGGYTKNGQHIPYGSASVDELDNIFTSPSSVDLKFVQKASDSAFDDILYIIERSTTMPFMCPDRGTNGTNLTLGPGYSKIEWTYTPAQFAAMNLSINPTAPTPKTVYKGCEGASVDPLTGTFSSCTSGTCYTGSIQRTCNASLTSNAAEWATGTTGTSSCTCPAQTMPGGNYWYSGSVWNATNTPATRTGTATTQTASCNSAYYTGTITRYCRGDDGNSVPTTPIPPAAGGWSTVSGSFTASTSANLSALPKNCLCKSKSVAAGTGFNAFTIPAGTAVGSSYAKTCDATGYSGTVNFLCQDQNGFAATTTSGGCIPNCPALTGYSSGNQYANWNSTAANSTNVAGSCKSGLVASTAGQPYRSCSSTGTWGGITGSCQCPAYTPGTGYNGTVNKANVGASQVLGCQSGYYDSDGTDGLNTVRYTCQSDGSWTRSGGACARPCNVNDSGNNVTGNGHAGMDIREINWGYYGDVQPGTYSPNIYGTYSGYGGGYTRSICASGGRIGAVRRYCNANGTWGAVSYAPNADCFYSDASNNYTDGAGYHQVIYYGGNYNTFYPPTGCYNFAVWMWAGGAGSADYWLVGRSGQGGASGSAILWTNQGRTGASSSFSVGVGTGGPYNWNPSDVGNDTYIYYNGNSFLRVRGGKRENEQGWPDQQHNGVPSMLLWNNDDGAYFKTGSFSQNIGWRGWDAPAGQTKPGGGSPGAWLGGAINDWVGNNGQPESYCWASGAWRPGTWWNYVGAGACIRYETTYTSRSGDNGLMVISCNWDGG